MSAALFAAGGTVVAMVIAYVFLRKSKRGETESPPPDTVILHQVSRGPHAPSISPYCLKLETYLRMAAIPYKNVPGRQMGPKGKVPWIELNGETLGDSHFSIEFLNDKFDRGLSSHLTPVERASATAFAKMCEEHLSWGMVMWRCDFDAERTVFRLSNLSAPVTWFICRRGRSMAWQQGMGRHSQSEVFRLMEQDLKALSDYIGEKKFLTGHMPCEEDCAVFGTLAQVLWHMPGSPLEPLLKEKYGNLVVYCERMKSSFWPDWEDCTTMGGTRPATK